MISYCKHCNAEIENEREKWKKRVCLACDEKRKDGHFFEQSRKAKEARLAGAANVEATHVLIRGMVFPWAAKAPYVASGRSVLGALEYNLEKDLVRCHVCGLWFTRLYLHLEKAEGMSPESYRSTYGLNQLTLLTGWKRQTSYKPKPPGFKGKQKARNDRPPKRKPRLTLPEVKEKVANLVNLLGRAPSRHEMRLHDLSPCTFKLTTGAKSVTEGLAKLGIQIPRPDGPRTYNTDAIRVPTSHRLGAEDRNLHSLCQAQIRTRLLQLVDNLGRIPKRRELELAGLRYDSIPFALGVSGMPEVWEELGLRVKGGATSGMVYRPDMTV